jgi:hypothetical protein
MSIPKCCGDVVYNEVMGKSFYYCRGCCKEVNDSIEIQVVSYENLIFDARCKRKLLENLAALIAETST